MTNGTPADDRLKIEKHCEILATNARHRTDAMANWFKLYLQLYSAIVGGAIALRLQAFSHPEIPKELLHRFARLSDWLVFFLGVASVVMVVDARRAEFMQRLRMTEIAGEDNIPPPARFWRAVTMDSVEVLRLWRTERRLAVEADNRFRQWIGCITMVIVIAVTTIAFVCLNPLAR